MQRQTILTVPLTHEKRTKSVTTDASAELENAIEAQLFLDVTAMTGAKDTAPKLNITFEVSADKIHWHKHTEFKTVTSKSQQLINVTGTGKFSRFVTTIDGSKASFTYGIRVVGMR